MIDTQTREKAGQLRIGGTPISLGYSSLSRSLYVADGQTGAVFVVDGNFGNRSELLLVHQHEGLDIQLDWASVTLGNLTGIWGRTVHLDTQVDGKPIRLTHAGTEITRTARAETEADG